ncbi:hypothetical protein [Bacillus sp. S/N-304-OC-R1]|uniref:hypothetical protein n=1 Tax=Bacillus sp. S/N-304-OC-R1 TaxID=2758034 RepID=UPI001C8D6295|nr:hypothetical protein [Bacillus sp. S/N-304-OC-R1]MBY0121600.1 hypothetical protein [Bacillus sp. S/N-304-OC-R1]
MSYRNYLDVLGLNIRARHHIEKENHDPFKNPIIHKRLDGLEIVPIDRTRLWGK